MEFLWPRKTIFLVQANLGDIDAGAKDLSIYNSTNPAEPFSGLNNFQLHAEAMPLRERQGRHRGDYRKAARCRLKPDVGL